MKSKMLSFFGGLCATAVLLTGCGKDAQDVSANADGSSNGKQIELKFSWWGSEDRHNAFLKIIDLYEKEHPNIKISPEYGAWTGWQQNIITQLGGGTEADIMQVNYNWIHSFGKGKNVFYDLNKVSDKLNLDNWDKEHLKSMTVNNELAAVPHGMNARINFYNKPLFEKAGIKYPSTYKELVDAGKIIGKENTPTGSENKYVFMNIGKECPDLFIAQMLFDETNKVMQKDGKVQYTVDEVEKVFNEYLNFANSGAMETFQQLDSMDNESNPVWTSGRGGSIYEWANAIDKYAGSYKGGNAKDEIGVASYIVPKEGVKPSIYVKPNLGYAISKNCKYPEEAADFINFIFTNEEAVKIMGTSIGISSNKVTKEYQEKNGIIKGLTKEAYDMMDNYKQVVMDPYFEDANVRGQRILAIEAFRSGKSSTREAANDYIVRQQEQLDKLFK